MHLVAVADDVEVLEAIFARGLVLLNRRQARVAPVRDECALVAFLADGGVVAERGRELRGLMSWVKKNDDDYVEGTAAR